MAAFGKHPISLKEAIFVLKLKWRHGFRYVTFTGGEPTMYPDFPKVLRYAKQMGYRTHLITNGNTIANGKYSARILPHLDEVCVSIHGPSAAVMDPITRLKGSFALVERALMNIEASSHETYVVASCILSAGNIDALAATLEYVARYRKVKHFTVANTAPIGGGLHRYAALTVRLGELAKIVPMLKALADKHRLPLRFFGTPACALGSGYQELADDFHWPEVHERVIVQRGRDAAGRVGLMEISTTAHVRERAQTHACEPCAVNDSCAGLFTKYREMFGDGELTPIARRPDPSAASRPRLASPRFQVTAFWPKPEERPSISAKRG